MFFGVSQSNGDKRIEPGTCLVEHTQCAVASIDERTRLFDKVTEQDRELDGGFDHEDGVDETQKLGRILNVVIRHELIVAFSGVSTHLPPAGQWFGSLSNADTMECNEHPCVPA